MKIKNSKKCLKFSTILRSFLTQIIFYSNAWFVFQIYDNTHTFRILSISHEIFIYSYFDFTFFWFFSHDTGDLKMLFVFLFCRNIFIVQWFDFRIITKNIKIFYQILFFGIGLHNDKWRILWWDTWECELGRIIVGMRKPKSSNRIYINLLCRQLKHKTNEIFFRINIILLSFIEFFPHINSDCYMLWTSSYNLIYVCQYIVVWFQFYFDGFSHVRFGFNHDFSFF